MISQEALPENLVSKCMDVLRTLSANERDLIRLVVEVIHDLRDPSDSEDELSVRLNFSAYFYTLIPVTQRERSNADDGEKAFGGTPAPEKPPAPAKSTSPLSPEEQARADAIDLRCLSLCIGMLERVHGVYCSLQLNDVVLTNLCSHDRNSRRIQPWKASLES
jgi:condensin complex subunit 3